MIKKKNLFCGVMVLATLVMPNSVMASTHQQFAFSLKATGQEFRIDTNSGNQKTIKGNPWTYKPYHLSTGASPYGMLFVPYHRTRKEFCTSAQRWRRTGQYELITTPFGTGYTGPYYLAARTDDTASGKYSSDCWWNADTVK